MNGQPGNGQSTVRELVGIGGLLTRSSCCSAYATTVYVDEHELAWQRFAQRERTGSLLSVLASRLGSKGRFVPLTVLATGAKLAARAPALGRPCYFGFQVTLDGHQQVREAVHALQRELDFPFVWSVPDHALHFSVLGLDHLGSLPPEQQADLAARGHKVLQSTEPFAVHICNATASFAAAAFEVHDDGAIRAIRARLWQALPWVLEQRADPYTYGGRDMFRPHLSVGYFVAEEDNRLVVEVLRRFRPYEVGRLVVARVDLVKVPLLSYDRRVVGSFELRGPGS